MLAARVREKGTRSYDLSLHQKGKKTVEKIIDKQ